MDLLERSVLDNSDNVVREIHVIAQDTHRVLKDLEKMIGHDRRMRKHNLIIEIVAIAVASTALALAVYDIFNTQELDRKVVEVDRKLLSTMEPV